MVETVLPFLTRTIAAEDHATGAPRGLVVTGDFDDEITFFLRGVGQIAPLAQRPAGGVGRIKDRPRRQRRGVHDPRGRDQRAKEFERAAAERLSPVIGEQVMVEKREGELLLLERAHGRRQGDFAGRPRFKDKLFRADVGQIEELEKTVDDVDFFRVAVGREKEGVFEGKNIFGLQAKHAVAEELQLMREPVHLGAVSRGFVAHHEGDERIAFAGTQGGERGVEVFDHRIGGAEDGRGGITGGVETIQKGGQADAARHGVELGHDEAFVGQQEVGPEDGGKCAAILRITGVGDEMRGLAAVEVVGDPRREQGLVAQEIFSGGGAQVEILERLVKLEAGNADGFELRDLLGRKRPRLGRKLPSLVLKQRLRSERGAEVFVGQVGHDERIGTES